MHTDATLMPGLRSLDAFGKIAPDAEVRTSSGGLITIVSFATIVLLVGAQYAAFRTVVVTPELVVDRVRGERMRIELNISFPHVPCSILGLDVMDVSGETQQDVSQTVVKTRLDETGTAVASTESVDSRVSSLDIDLPDGYCGPCYDAEPVDGDSCCNTCESVKSAYAMAGWKLDDYDSFEQCRRENYINLLNERAREGCRMSGYLEVNKVIGQFHFAPGRSIVHSNGAHIHDLGIYYGNKHDFSHHIHSLRFGELIERLQTDPLSGIAKLTDNQNYNYIYFVKCVSTTYTYLDPGRPPVSTNQYSVTSHERTIEGGMDPDHPHAIHARGGVPGVFVQYDISPMRVIQRETRQGTFGEFLSSTIGIVGGVLVIAQAMDRLIFEGRRVSLTIFRNSFIKAF